MSLRDRERELRRQLQDVRRKIGDLLPSATTPLTPDRPPDARPLRQDEYEPLRAEEVRLEAELQDVRRRQADGEA